MLKFVCLWWVFFHRGRGPVCGVLAMVELARFPTYGSLDELVRCPPSLRRHYVITQPISSTWRVRYPVPSFIAAGERLATPEKTTTVHAPHPRPYPPVRLRTWPAAETCRGMKHIYSKISRSPRLPVPCRKAQPLISWLSHIVYHSVLPPCFLRARPRSDDAGHAARVERCLLPPPP